MPAEEHGGDRTKASRLVQGGDTLFDLAQRYGVTVDDLLRANRLSSDYIYVGQQLIIPQNEMPRC